MKPSTEIILDKSRQLRFTTNALILLEELMQKPITKLDFNNVGLKDIRMIIYCGLKHEDKNLTLEKTGELLDYSDLESISKVLGEALSNSFGPKKEGNSSGE